MVDTPPQWQIIRPCFHAQIDTAATALNVEVTWLSADWVCRLRSGTRTASIVGYSFPLNNASSAHLANDKVAAFEVLHSHGVPAIEHHLVRFRWQPSKTGRAPSVVAADDWTTAADLEAPLVIKPHADGGGVDVVRALTPAEVRAHLAALSIRYRAVAVSPFVDIGAEYRLVVLDDEVVLAFGKRRQGLHEWRHNLRFGAVPEPVAPSDLAAEVGGLARAAMAVLGLRFASVDVVSVGGAWLVLEVNVGVCLEHFSSHSPTTFAQALEVYGAALQRVFP